MLFPSINGSCVGGLITICHFLINNTYIRCSMIDCWMINKCWDHRTRILCLSQTNLETLVDLCDRGPQVPWLLTHSSRCGWGRASRPGLPAPQSLLALPLQCLCTIYVCSSLLSWTVVITSSGCMWEEKSGPSAGPLSTSHSPRLEVPQLRSGDATSIHLQGGLCAVSEIMCKGFKTVPGT